MAIFENRRPSSQGAGLESNAKGVNGADMDAGALAWEDTTDLGLNAAEREANLKRLETPKATGLESFAAGVGNSIVGAAVRKATMPDFPEDTSFDLGTTMTADTSLRILGYSEEELNFIGGSRSLDEYQYRKEAVEDQRKRDGVQAENMFAGIAGNLAGDAPFLLAPMGAAGVVGRTGMAVRAALRAGELATTYYAQDQLGQAEWVTAVAAGLIGVDQLYDVSRATRGVRAAANAAEVESRALGSATEHVFTAETGLARKAQTGGVLSDAPEIVPDVVKPEVAAQRMPDPDAPVNEVPEVVKVPRTGKGERSFPLQDTPVEGRIVASRQGRKTVQIKAQDLVTHLRTMDSLSDSARALMDALPDTISGMEVRLMNATGRRSSYTFGANTEFLKLRSTAKDGTVFKTVGDMLNHVDADVAVHELIHAATSKTLFQASKGNVAPEIADAIRDLDALHASLKNNREFARKYSYAMTNNREFLAELASKPEMVKDLAKLPGVRAGQNALQAVAEKILKMLGFKGTGSALDEAVDAFVKVANYQADNLDKVNAFFSDGMADLADDANRGATAVERAKRLEQGVRKSLKQSFALWDNIARGSEDLANLLVSDATRMGERATSVVDHKRNLTLEQNLRAAAVEDAIVAAMREKHGVNTFDMFFNRAKARTARSVEEDKLTKYLHEAYSAEKAGREIPTPPADIERLVKAYTDSGWAESWHEHLVKSGTISADEFPRSKYYIPRQYSYEKVRNIEPPKVKKLLRSALQDTYTNMDGKLAARVADSWYNRIVNGVSGNGGPQWKNLMQGMDNDELFMALRDAGVEDDKINEFLRVNVPKTGSTAPVKNLRNRLDLNLNKEFDIDGDVLRLSDILETNTLGLMQGYTNRMSGRVAFANRGITDLRTLDRSITETRLGMGEGAESWGKAVDDTIDHLLGYPVGTDIPELMRGASNLANTVMLKNSGLYQMTDISIAMKEFGLARVLRGLASTGLLRKADAVVADTGSRERLYSILNGAYQNEARYRHIHTYADDNLDLTNTSAAFQTTQNLSQAARLANGFSMVHRLMANLNAGIICDEVERVLKGGTSRALTEHGLTPELTQKLRAAYAENPTGVFPYEIQRELEIVSTRAMDSVMQNIRTGETSHFAQFSPVGKIVVGYQSFAIAATNKLLRRYTQNGDYAGLAMLMMYQFPLMLMATHAKLALDGKEAQSPRELITNTAMNMSAIGGITLLSPLFLGESPRHSLTSLGYVTQSIGAVQNMVSDGRMDTQRMSKILPFAQEFMPLRAVINNMGE
ncbi:peptidoglycan lytic exotransglycosylase [Vibrio phage vB_VpP_NS8]|nr:peptidoglycan lytic exotransglycosylase [Vibrio phage vB_VpP_NS8]